MTTASLNVHDRYAPLGDSLEQVARETPSQGKNYLERCVEEINCNEAIAAKKDRYATAYKVAAYVVMGLFIVAGASAVILTGIYAPVFVPITMMTALCLINPVLTGVKHLFAQAQINQMIAERTRAVAREYRAINEIDSTTTRTNIVNLAPDVDTNESDSLKPLLAHYNYWNRVYTEKDDQLRNKICEARRLEPKESVEKYLEAAILRQEALVAKVSKAFIIAVMKNPQFQGTVDDLGSLRDYSIPATIADKTLTASLESNEWAQRALLQDFNDARAGGEFLVFNNPENRPVSFREAMELSDQAIAQRFLQAMRPMPVS